jgi:DNA-binding SARP family transcriptional activator
MDAPWRIELLGWLRATQGDHVVSRFRSQKIRSLLAFLAYHSHHSHPRETLIELLWPECDPAAGRHRLRQALCLLRHQLEPPGVPAGAVILANHAAVQVNPAACITDVAQFEAALQLAVQAGSSSGCEQALRLIQAVELYRGELLPGCFEDWVLPERQRLSEAYLQALDQLVGLLEQTGDLHGALQYARRAVAVDPLREETHHTMIRLLVAAGQPEAALRQYDELERLMARELDTTPASETRALLAEIRSGAGAKAPPAARGARVSASRHPHSEAPYASQPLSSVPSSPPVPAASTDPLPARAGHLPLQLTRFFGREQEIIWLCNLLSGEGISAVGGGISDSEPPEVSRPIQNPKSKIACSPSPAPAAAAKPASPSMPPNGFVQRSPAGSGSCHCSTW